MATDAQGYIAALVAREGGYTADSADPGGATCWGITEPVARAYGYEGAMQDLPVTTAEAIYLAQYWHRPHLDRLDAIDSELAAKLLDTGVNMGPQTAVRYLQRALRVLVDAGASLAVDGDLGPLTLHALQVFLYQRGDDGRAVLLGMIRGQQSVGYIGLAEATPAERKFEYGWQKQRALL
jgi:lysozyme family protein